MCYECFSPSTCRCLLKGLACLWAKAPVTALSTESWESLVASANFTLVPRKQKLSLYRHMDGGFATSLEKASVES